MKTRRVIGYLLILPAILSVVAAILRVAYNISDTLAYTYCMARNPYAHVACSNTVGYGWIGVAVFVLFPIGIWLTARDAINKKGVRTMTKQEKPPQMCPLISLEQCHKTHCAWFDDTAEVCAIMSLTQAANTLALCVNVLDGTFVTSVCPPSSKLTA